ncbi:MAG: DUF1802 family protein [Cyanobacteria bacterium P01_A01_bin.123]
MATQTTTGLQAALKEWSIAVDALAQGETIMLLRKGGIREAAGRFTVKRDRVWLYPTYEHQKPHLLKPAYKTQVTSVPSGWHPDSVAIKAWAEITHIFSIDQAHSVDTLLPHHIWTEQFAAERFHWKPNQPLFVLLLRVHRLTQAIAIPYQTSYGGCRSWIELAATLATTPSTPVLTEAEYQRQVNTLQTLLLKRP